MSLEFLKSEIFPNFIKHRVNANPPAGGGTDESEGYSKINWNLGVPEVALISAIVGPILGIPLMLQLPTILQCGQVVFYVVLFLIGVLGHIDDVNRQQFDLITKERLLTGVALGVLGYLAIVITFTMNLALLETLTQGTTCSLSLSNVQLAVFNIAFIVPGEELVFRDTLPYWISNLLMKVSKDNEIISLTIAFLFSSIAFGLLHIFSYNGDYIGVIKAIVSGGILSLIRWKGGLLASFIAHLAYNLSIVVGLYIIPTIH